MAKDDLIYLRVRFDPLHPEKLREGLETCLQLGLIDQSQVKRICENYLSSPLPDLLPINESEVFPDITPQRVESPSSWHSSLDSQHASSGESSVSPLFSWQPWIKFQTVISHVWVSFKDELSVRWLLFLGLFLVIVSSGVLAATQWQSFPNTGQYLILLGYTLSFFGVSLWSNRQENLQLTAKTLRNIGLLLIPINFWAMDAFNLWNHPLNLGLILLSAVGLSVLYYRFSIARQNLAIILNYLGLSYLHWGWSEQNRVLGLIYGGFIATALILTFLNVPKSLPASRRFSLDTPKGFVIYGISVILGRSIFISHLSLVSLGFAIALLGWLLQDHNSRTSMKGVSETVTTFLEYIGAILLFLGWFVTVFQVFPWQSVLITLLAIHFFTQRLQRLWLRRDVLALYLIGFQGCFLLWRLIPLTYRQEILNFASNLSGYPSLTLSFLSLLFFPVIGLGIGLTHWLERKSQVKLADFSEKLSLILVFMGILGSFTNPLWRSLVLLLSSVTLIYLLRYRSSRLIFVYLSHLLGLGGIISLIDWYLPDLSPTLWASLLLGLMGVEWGLSIRRTFRQNSAVTKTFYTSCWYFGFILSFVAYCLLWPTVERFVANHQQYLQGLLWLTTPLSLTLVAGQVKSQQKRRHIAFISSYAAIIAQSLTLWQPKIRLVALIVGTLLTLINTYYCRTPLMAKIHIGFWVVLITIGQLEVFSGYLTDFSLSYPLLLSHIAIIAILWFIPLHLLPHRPLFAKIYTKAMNQWGLFLTITVLIRLIFVQIGEIPANFNYLWVCLSLITLIIYRYWRNPSNLAVYTVIGLVELGFLHGVKLGNQSLLTVAFLNILASFASLILIKTVLGNIPRFSSLNSLKYVPLLLGCLGILFRLGEFNAYTGLISIGCGISGLTSLYRIEKRKSLTYIYLTLISLGIYEYILYQGSQTSQPIAYRFLYLSLTSVMIAFFYPFILGVKPSPRQGIFRDLSPTDIERMSHYYWGIAGFLKVFAFQGILQENLSPHPLVLGSTLSIAIYGFLQGRDLRSSDGGWIYLGWIDGIITVMMARLIWQDLSILDPFWTSITVIIALAIYICPWQRLGWTQSPWKRVALTLPFIIVIITGIAFQTLSKTSLLTTAIFYLIVALTEKNIRWSYLSLGFFNGFLLQVLYDANIKEFIWTSSLMGFTLLYIAQFDPILKQPSQVQSRHSLRLTGSSIMGITALLFYQKTGLIPAMYGLLGVFAGLGFKIRAFLFVGTITFILTVAYQLLILSFQYAFLKWVIGLIVGILLIVIAANFEQRKEQVSSLWQSWQGTWTHWE